jgi:hypothetical protein
MKNPSVRGIDLSKNGNQESLARHYRKAIEGVQ